MTELQLEFDLGDKFQRAEGIVKQLRNEFRRGSNSSVRLFKSHHFGVYRYYIGTRTYVYEVELDFIQEIDLETALHLYHNLGVDDYMGWIQNNSCISEQNILNNYTE